MLLLLKSPASVNPAGALTATGSLNATGSTGSVNLSGTGSLALANFELHVFGIFSGAGDLQALPQNFRTGFGSLTANGDLQGTPGFGPTAVLAGLGNLSGTVGTVFQGIAALNAQGGLTAAGRIISSAQLTGLGKLAAVGAVSGGIVTPTAVLAAVGALTVTGTVLSITASLDGQGDLQGAGFPSIVGLATQMRLSFSCDEIRTFFRKG
jgi:hypothetical protein